MGKFDSVSDLRQFWHLIRKIRLISKFMTSEPGKQTITIYVLPTFSTNKGNQAIWSVNRI